MQAEYWLGFSHQGILQPATAAFPSYSTKGIATYKNREHRAQHIDRIPFVESHSASK